MYFLAEQIMILFRITRRKAIEREEAEVIGKELHPEKKSE